MHHRDRAPADLKGAVVFDEAVYRAWNPDVDEAIRAGTLGSARLHFERFGRDEQRPPYCAPAAGCGSPPLKVGDVLLQRVVPAADWWAGAAFSLGTAGALVRVRFSGAILHGDTGETLREFELDEWAADGERLVLKFRPLEASSGVSQVVRLRVCHVEAPHAVQLNCTAASGADGLIWNEAAPAAVRGIFELLYTPPTVPGPRGITLNPLTHCPGECVHCLARSHQKRPGALKPEWVEALRVHFRDGPGLSWCVDYATDYFAAARARPELIDLIAACGDLSVNTDGQHLTRETLQRLLKGNVRQIGFSCDAATEETYAKVRKGRGRLETVLASARLALDLRRERGDTGRPWIALSMVVMQANVQEVVALVDVAARTGVDAVWYNQLWVCSEAMVGQSMTHAPGVWREAWERARVRGRELGVGVFAGIDIRPEHPQRGVSWCPEPWNSFIVLGNGDVLACASPASRIGSLRASTIEEIWNGPAFQALRRRVNTDRPPLMCEHCFAYRKPGNADGLFTHHLVEGYDLKRDLEDESYAAQFPGRFSFRASPHRADEHRSCHS